MTDEQRKRIHAITYSTDDRAELAERIVRLEDERDHWRVEQVHAYSNWEDAHKRASELEDENAKLREAEERDADVMEALNISLEESQDENAKLRELVRKWYPHMARRVGKDALAQWGQLDVLRELGIEVTENE